MRMMTLAGGRELAYQVMGDPDGSPVMGLHGTPGSSRQLASLDKPARAREEIIGAMRQV